MESRAAKVESGRVVDTIIGTAAWANEMMEGEWYDCGLEVSRDWLLVDGKFRVYPPYPSWTWDGAEYQPPTPEPDPVDGFVWAWDEMLQSWHQVEIPPAI